jgi:hypothetical protein
MEFYSADIEMLVFGWNTLYIEYYDTKIQYTGDPILMSFVEVGF